MGEVLRMQKSIDKISSADRRKHIEDAVNYIMIGGYVLEFGIGGGQSLNCISGRTNRTVHGFDSFEGLPEEWSPNKHLIFAKGSFKYDPPENIQDNVKLVTGWFKDTIPVWKEINFGPIAFLHIDSDLYSSCVTILTELDDQIVPGTIILFDELIDYTNWEEGEWKALQEWIKTHNREVFELGSHQTQVTYRVIK